MGVDICSMECVGDCPRHDLIRRFVLPGPGAEEPKSLSWKVEGACMVASVDKG